MPTQEITFPLTGDHYTNDDNPVTGLYNGGQRRNFFPMLNNALLVAQQCLDAAASAVNAPGTSGTSTSSLTIGLGIKTLTIQTGKDFSVGQNIVCAYTPDAANYQMSGKITAYDDNTGVLSFKVLDTDAIGTGTFAAWTVSLVGAKGVPGFSMYVYPIFSQEAAARNLVSPMMPIFENSYTIASLGFIRLMWAGSQFIAVPESANVNIYTSPDLKTWTARSVSGASMQWTIRNNGNNVIAIPSSGTVPYKSTDGGVTWSAAAALSGSIISNGGAYTSNGICMISMISSNYISTNNGTSWSSSQTLPHTSTNVFAQGTNLVSYNNASNTYYTSPTGMTGDWTARALPNSISAGTLYEDGSNGLLLVPTDIAKNYWHTTDGLNWTDLGFNAATFQNAGGTSATFYIPFRINGVWCVGSSLSSGSVFVKHAGSKWIPTNCGTISLSLPTPKYCMVAGNGSGLYGVKPSSISNILTATNTTSKCTGYFV